MTKRKDPKDKLKVGRHTVMTTEILDKLEYAFLMGFTDTDARIYAGISHGAYYDYIDKHPDFKEKVYMWKRNMSIKARINIAKKIESGDTNESKWWLERKDKEEFSTKTETFNTGGIEVKKVFITKEEKKEAENHIDSVINEG